MKHLYAVLFFLFGCSLFTSTTSAQCTGGQQNFVVHVLTDNWGYEVSWTLKDAGGTTVLSSPGMGNDLLYKDSVCVDTLGCYTFSITDSYGDGITNGGYFKIFLDGVQMAQGTNFGFQTEHVFNCEPGSNCGSGITVATENEYTAPGNDTWYSFTPDSTGQYTVSTCGLNTCNTVIWVYDHCAGLNVTGTNVGTIAFNDDACGLQSSVAVPFQAGTSYFIRIGSASGNCTGEINWSLSGPEPIYGCTDPTACNYQPLATIDTGGCVAFGSLECPQAPDLMVVESAFLSSLSIGNQAATNCTVQEQCLMGFGSRRVISFTTHIKNIGELDYYIGNAANNPDQFNTINCHGHDHYEGYAEYTLYDAAGVELPIGFKNGFCVIDLECSGGGQAQYGCNNMGITAGCGDIYGSGTTCQWVDITDVDTGTYTLVIRVNWDKSPDALGRIESTYDNNWAQACIHIFYDGTGQKDFTISSDCDPYVDCLGEIYGPAQPDCNGVCNGSAKRGDLDGNSLYNLFDINAYMSGIVDETLAATPCNDLYLDNAITVYEAALLNDCTLYGTAFPQPGGGTHNYCDFPTGVYNFNDTMTFKIAEVNSDDMYVDVHVRNPTADLNAFEFKVKGLTIANVLNISSPGDYPATPQFATSGVKVACYSAVDSSLTKSNTFQPLCRIYYSSIGDTVCIEEVIETVNQLNQKTAHKTDDNCVVLFDYVSGIEAGRNIEAIPNPTTGDLNVRFNLPASAPFTIKVVNALGQVMLSESHQAALSFDTRLSLGHLPAGTYTLKVEGSTINASRKVVLVR